jgi:hypothetical protein
MVLEPFVEAAAGLLGAVGSADDAPHAPNSAEMVRMKNARFTILIPPGWQIDTRHRMREPLPRRNHAVSRR